MCSAFRQQWFASVALSASETAHATMGETTHREADTMTSSRNLSLLLSSQGMQTKRTEREVLVGV